MWIENTEPETHPTAAMRNELTNGKLVEFTSTHKANVPEDVAKSLVERYDHFVISDSTGNRETPETETETTE